MRERVNSPQMDNEYQLSVTPILLFFAVKEESRFFCQYLKQQGYCLDKKGIYSPSTSKKCTLPPLRIYYIGMGKSCALRATEEISIQFPPQYVITAGFAGALDPQFKIGDVLIQQNLFFPHILQNKENIHLHKTRFFQTEHVITTAKEKAELFRSTQCGAVEMESGTIMEYCSRQKIPCIIIRSISDQADEDLAVDFNQILKPNGKISLFRLSSTILASPHKRIPALIHLGINSSRAAKALADSLIKLISLLPRSDCQ